MQFKTVVWAATLLFPLSLALPSPDITPQAVSTTDLRPRGGPYRVVAGINIVWSKTQITMSGVTTPNLLLYESIQTSQQYARGAFAHCRELVSDAGLDVGDLASLENARYTGGYINLLTNGVTSAIQLAMTVTLDEYDVTDTLVEAFASYWRGSGYSVTAFPQQVDAVPPGFYMTPNKRSLGEVFGKILEKKSLNQMLGLDVIQKRQSSICSNPIDLRRQFTNAEPAASGYTLVNMC